jgi:hypothetical protein
LQSGSPKSRSYDGWHNNFQVIEEYGLYGGFEATRRPRQGLSLNLEGSIYGTLAEIDAGLEVT